MKKNDENKTRYELIPTGPLAEIAEIMTRGAERYGQDNWKENIEAETGRVLGAIFRHLEAYRAAREREDPDGYWNTDDWGHHHLSHVMVCALFLVWNDQQNLE